MIGWLNNCMNKQVGRRSSLVIDGTVNILVSTLQRPHCYFRLTVLEVAEMQFPERHNTWLDGLPSACLSHHPIVVREVSHAQSPMWMCVSLLPGCLSSCFVCLWLRGGWQRQEVAGQWVWGGLRRRRRGSDVDGKPSLLQAQYCNSALTGGGLVC